MMRAYELMVILSGDLDEPVAQGWTKSISDSITACPFDGTMAGLPMSQSTKPTSNADTAQPVAMALVIAQPLPKSINFAAPGATPSAASGEAPSSVTVKMEAMRENRDMRAGAGDG